ncbi:hypothetical protein D9758_014135 [Tetrapyrgos nigripes]|uniref:FAD/NAD(P)-binding domain-containing protein n=1 Tax=Tetrapyrgos nigripes TaxID=182062 RepID=A0A8H5CP81_9AGAR|nr:hypothetical protein D9758_014135 [Tetrapyrgos nigripes]
MNTTTLASTTLTLALLLLLLRFLVRIYRLQLLNKETILLDLPNLGRAREETEKIPVTVVVCGGSIAGLLAARVCHDHFERIVIVEPEAWLSTEEGRKVKSWTQDGKRARVMQYTSLHGNLAPVTDGLLRLFPNFEEECRRSDINLAPADFKIYLGGHKFIAPHDEFGGSFPLTAMAGRQATETLVRRLTLNKKMYPNIEQIAGIVTGVDADEKDPRYLKTVRVRTNEGEDRELDAALVIEWIKGAGYGSGPNPLDELTLSYDPRMRYASFKLRLPKDLISKLPEYERESSTGALFLYKADPSVARTYCGAMDAEGEFRVFKKHKSATPIPEWIWKFFDMCQEAEDTMQLSKVRVPASFWTRYELASHLPANYIALGDSVTRVNPVFGQGGSKAMMGAVALNNVLQDVHTKSLPHDFSRRFFRSQADKISPLWYANKLADYGYDTTVPQHGESLSQGAVIRWYLHTLEIMSDKDKQIGSIFWRAMHSYGTSIDALNPLIIVKFLVQILSFGISGK